MIRSLFHCSFHFIPKSFYSQLPVVSFLLENNPEISCYSESLAPKVTARLLFQNDTIAVHFLSYHLFVRVYVSATPVIDRTTSAVVEKNGYVECKIKKANPAPEITWEMQPYCIRHLADCRPDLKLWRKVPEDRFTIISSNTSSDTTLLVPATSTQHYFFRCTARNKAGKDEHIVKFFYISGGNS